MDTWEDISGGPLFTGEEYHVIWEQFYNEFRFNPGIASMPAINEPTPSITYFVGHIYGPPDHYLALVRDLNSKMLTAFQRCVSPDGWLYALDWRHPGYRFRPHIPFNAANDDDWRVPVLPNGDYYIFLAEDLRFGVFGHPWEETMCIWGGELLEALSENPPLLFDTMIRENGRQIRPLIRGFFEIEGGKRQYRTIVGSNGFPLAAFIDDVERAGYDLPSGHLQRISTIATEDIAHG